MVECDPSIRALIVKIDTDRHDIVIQINSFIQELDDTHLLIDGSKVDFIKAELNRILAENTYNPLDEEEEVA
ncbi:RNA polymerase II transcription factor B subunit 5 [Cyberlindnera fabianii]|nr:RNA polymerase II transcription factor B subunit 5 [Cyberlindnera fabianii]